MCFHLTEIRLDSDTGEKVLILLIQDKNNINIT